MIEELAELIDDFPGPANQMCFFLHILNLVVKSILRQFDLPKSKKSISNDNDGNDSLDQATEELLRLASDIDLEEELTANDDDDEEDDNDEGWIDEHEEMTEDELRELAESVGPVRLLLTKVRLQI